MDEQRFFLAYAECALWASQDEEGESLDVFDVSDIHPETQAAMQEDCKGFLDGLSKTALDSVRDNPERAGMDFWLTRNCHGAGFWDGSWGEEGDYLTDEAHGYGSCDLFVDDTSGTTTIRHN